MGKVYMVGAGPGDPGLLTIKAKRLLERADAVLYDALVDPAVLSLCPDGCLLECVGKRGGRSSVSQESINARLVELAGECGVLVRLKGGDPFVFGRGGEEARHLADKGVPFEIVPGVSSATAAASAVGIPVTHRDCSHAFRIVTAHPREGVSLDFSELAKSEDTLVFLMGISRLGQIARGLIGGGMPAGTPAAVVCAATTPGQTVLEAPLGDLEERAAAAGVKSPGVILVGQSVGRRVYPESAVKAPRARPVLLLRPSHQAPSMMSALTEMGLRGVSFPVIEIEPNCVGQERLRGLFSGGFPFTHAVFTSANGVELFFNELIEGAGMDARALAGVGVAAIGPATAEALLNFGLKADIVPDRFNSRALFDELRPRLKPSDRVLLARSGRADPFLREAIGEICEVTEIGLYDAVDVAYDPRRVRRLMGEGPAAVVFMSSSEAEAFSKLIGPGGLGDALCVSIGPCTTRKLKALGYENVVEADRSTAEGVLEKLDEVLLGGN